MWQERWSSSRNRKYYFNPTTGESLWDRPAQETVHCLHILIKHAHSRRPSSHRTPHITINRDDAVSKLNQLRESITSEEDFRRAAMEWSDCSSFGRGGDLGEFTKGKMQAAFEEAAFGLRVGEMSGVVESESGVHLIWRVA